MCVYSVLRALYSRLIEWALVELLNPFNNFQGFIQDFQPEGEMTTAVQHWKFGVGGGGAENLAEWLSKVHFGG